jgi:hypothetical protein
MRKATKTVAACLGVLAGLAGLEHGYFEILQGNHTPAGLMFVSWGSDVCDPAKIWHACEPAMSLLPNFLITGIVTVVLSLIIIVCSAAFVQRKHGGMVLLLLSIVQLLLGGGFFPPLIGILGAVAGIQINRPLAGKASGPTEIAARLWPWTLVVLIAWLLGEFLLGHFFNDFLKSIMGFSLLLILILLPLSVYSAYAHDAIEES